MKTFQLLKKLNNILKAFVYGSFSHDFKKKHKNKKKPFPKAKRQNSIHQHGIPKKTKSHQPFLNWSLSKVVLFSSSGSRRTPLATSLWQAFRAAARISSLWGRWTHAQCGGLNYTKRRHLDIYWETHFSLSHVQGAFLIGLSVPGIISFIFCTSSLYAPQ